MITFIISARNENKEPLNTIKSLWDSIEDKELFKIILVNDGSSEWTKIPKKYNIKEITHAIPQGIHASIDEVVELVDTEHIGILNARMRFRKGWFTELSKHLKNKQLLSCTSVVLRPNQTDMDKAETKRYGADIHYKNGDNYLIARWRKEENKDIYDIPCALGASYFMTKKWYKHIKGLQGLCMWGSLQEFLSLKTWKFGGKVKLLKTVEIGNIYQDKKGDEKRYTDSHIDIIWNKLFMAFTLFDWKFAINLLGEYYESEYYNPLKLMLITDMPKIMEYEKYFKVYGRFDINNLIIK